ncbi:MAG: hypothetical protein HYW49_04300 [Deltaproteobacteria bacterium]|nr:hypothetical protein [Deltaproteobacteria bacterium]
MSEEFMRKIIIGLVALSSITAFADCSVEIDLYTNIDRGASPQYFPPARIHQTMQQSAKTEIAQILINKGYSVVDKYGTYKLYLAYDHGTGSRYDIGIGGRVSYKTVDRYITFMGPNFEKLMGKEKSANFLSEKNDKGLRNRKNALNWLVRKTSKIPRCN